VVDFLGHLLRHLPGKLLVVWDGLPQHRAKLVSEFIRAQRGRLAIEWLPVRPRTQSGGVHLGLLETSRTAQLLPRDFSELSYHARHALRRMRQRPALVIALWEQVHLFPL
jgi:hypothetical protein